MKKLLLFMIAMMTCLFLAVSPVYGEDKAYTISEIVHIVDGDTMDAMIDLGFNISLKVRIRLNGINTPESRTRDLKEKELGLMAKAFAVAFLTNAESLTLIVEKRGKFGRELGKILNEKNEDLGDELIKVGLAREYHGEKRNGWFNDVPPTEEIV